MIKRILRLVSDVMQRPKPERWRLADAEQTRRRYPKTFEIPPRLVRLNLPTGATVKLIFEPQPHPVGPWLGERMWLTITEVAAGPRYIGTLCNHPVVIEGIQQGDRICFGPEHVCEIEQRAA